MKSDDKLPKSGLNRATQHNDGQSTHPKAVGAPEAANLPVEFGRYRLTKLLGQGGMGLFIWRTIRSWIVMWR